MSPEAPESPRHDGPDAPGGRTGQIHLELLATLDLVGQGPGGPDEDPVGFAFGGWQAPLVDEHTGRQVAASSEGTDALLLGRRTHEIFSACWPHQEGGRDDDIATLFDRVPSTSPPAAVREVRERHERVEVVGHLNLVQTLLREKLFDELLLWLHPLVPGTGEKVFDGCVVPANLTLLAPPDAGPRGTVFLRCGLAEGVPATGDATAG